MMSTEYIAQIRGLMEYEARRTGPPEGFPELPDIPSGRYRDPAFFQLEQQHVWGKSWLLASHSDEIPEPGCFVRWQRTR